MKMQQSLLAILSGLLLSGCFATGNGDLEAFIQQARNSEAGPVEPAPTIPLFEGYSYAAAGQGIRSPFVFADEELPEETADNGIRPDTTRLRDELEAFSLDTLRMVGTLSQAGMIFALVKSKDGAVYRVSEGRYMGRNHGRITGVFPDRVELVEIVQDRPGGRFTERRASLALDE
ncbi:MAG: pilus assembly protein PilP [Gammaproteobacteria bacterium]